MNLSRARIALLACFFAASLVPYAGLTRERYDWHSSLSGPLAYDPPPEADFSWQPTAPVAGEEIQFNNRSTNSPTHSTWLFGDGTVAGAFAPRHRYSQPGDYRVQLMVSNASGEDTVSKTVTVGDFSASLIWNPISPVAGQTVSFYDTSPIHAESWAWDFGDGQSAPGEANPEHLYSDTGTYTVTLTIRLGGVARSTSEQVTVTGSPPSADFIWSPPSPSAADGVNFFDRSTGPPADWSWDFGDGATSSKPNPRHVYDMSGRYTVSLTTGNGLGSDTHFQEVTVAASDAEVMVSGPSSGRANTTIGFSATAARCEPDPDSWIWTTAGGAIQGAESGAAIQVRWPAPGNKTLTARNSACGSSHRGTWSLEIASAGGPPPLPPTGLTAGPAASHRGGVHASSEGDIQLGWTDNSSNEDGFRISRRTGDDPFQSFLTVAADTTRIVIPRETPSSVIEYRVEALNQRGGSGPSPSAQATTPPGHCVQTPRAVCLNGSRFQVEVEWMDPRGNRGEGIGVPLSLDTAYFWFFQETNAELVVKVLDGRPVNGNFWIFYGALSDVQYTLRVTDTETGQERVLFNPLSYLGSGVDINPFDAASSGVSNAESARDWISWPGIPVKNERVWFTDQSGIPTDSRTWEFGDGLTRLVTEGPVAEHVFRAVGEFPVSLTLPVTSGTFARFESATEIVPVVPRNAPSLRIAGPRLAQVDQSLTFSASAADCTPSPDGWQWTTQGAVEYDLSLGATVLLAWERAGNKLLTVRNTACQSALAIYSTRVVDSSGAPEPCLPGDTTLCLNDARFRVEVEWQTPDGTTGIGHAASLTNDTGTFWFFRSANIELILKILDGRPVNQHFWVFWGALSDVGYTITITDTHTGTSRQYVNEPGEIVSYADTTAFSG